MSSEPGELIQLDYELLKDPAIANLSEVDINAQGLGEWPEKDERKTLKAPLLPYRNL